MLGHVTVNKFTVATAAVVGATIVAATGNDGWGWLILVAMLFL